MVISGASEATIPIVVALPPNAFAYSTIGAPSVIWKLTALNRLNRKELVA